MLWLYQRMFFGNIDNPKNEKLSDLSGREWLYMAPLVIMSLWIGVYPQSFLDYVRQPVNAVVKHVRPDYPMPPQSGTEPIPQRAAR
jgi:NADH-quinone oxidoreductase subunit M